MSFEIDVNAWVYDFEVFKHDWMVTFINFKTNERRSFINDLEALKVFYKNEIELNSILVGYNNKWYDDHILRGLIHNCDPYNLSKWIITEGRNPWEYHGLRFKKNNIISYDIMGEMAIGAPVSLKQIEGYFGWRIFESPISFDIDRKLTEEELKVALEYNIYDVEATKKLFERFGSKIKSHIKLLEYFNIEPRKLNLSGASKAAIALEAEKTPHYNTFNYVTPKIIKETLDDLNESDLYLTFEQNVFYTDKDKKKEHSLSFVKKLRDFDFCFALGGGHGAQERIKKLNTKIWNLDVKSYYVSIMCQFDFVSRGLGVSGKQKLLNLLKLRIKEKDAGNVDLADGFKMLLVAIYGSMAFENSKLWDPQMQVSVCITGQLLLYILCKQLEPFCEILQINTDGIMIIPFNEEKCQEIYKKWESAFGMELELEIGKSIFQKDVNNYVFVKDDLNLNELNDKKLVSKKVKVKGLGVRFFNVRMQDEEFKQIANFVANNNYTIVDEAVVKNLLFNTPIEETICQCKDLIRFQFILKLMGDFKTLAEIDADGNFIRDLEGGLKCYRLFAVKNGSNFAKHKIVDDKDSFVKISKSSKNMLILNDDLNTYNIDEIDIDHDHYIKMAYDVLKLYGNEGTEELEDLF